MCFSTAASIGSGIVLTLIGIATLKKTRAPQEYLFASIPLLFGIQQFSEGYLWFLLSHNGALFQIKIATGIYLAFAQIVWPVWIPLSIILLEKQPVFRAILSVFLCIGIVVSFVLAYYLYAFDVSATIAGQHIYYNLNYPNTFLTIGGSFYLLATILPLLFTQYKSMWYLGVAIFISYLISAVYYESYLISVWCFFAACISILVYNIFLEIKNTTEYSKYP